MLNVILRGSQYIYQNLIKNHLVCSSHLKGTEPIRIPGTAVPARPAPGPAPSAGLCPSRARSHEVSASQEPTRVLLQKEEPPFGSLSRRQNIRVDPRFPSRVPPVGAAPAARSRDELPVIYSAFRPL